MAERSMRARIEAWHQYDCTLSLREIAKRVGCDEKYVSSCLSQLGRKVGVEGTDKPYSEKNQPTHSVFAAWAGNKHRNEVCAYQWLDGGHRRECDHPTNGRTYCVEHLELLGAKRAGPRYNYVR